jgi:uncharacterized protein with FMN-binding domain
MIIALVSLGLFLFAGLLLSYLTLHGLAEVRALVIQEVDLSRVADGAYSGSYHKGRWTYVVEVTVREHRIVSVKNLDMRVRSGAVKPWNDQASALILEKRAIELDVISGASVRSQAFEKAIEVALSTPAQ